MADVMEGSLGKPAQVSEDWKTEVQRRMKTAVEEFPLAMGGMVRFPKAMSAQKVFKIMSEAAEYSGTVPGYAAEKFPVAIKVRVHSPPGTAAEFAQSWEDGIKGMNEGHALARARMNWPGHIIEFLGKE